MKFSLITIFGILISIESFSQPFYPYFPSRLNYYLLAPEIIRTQNLQSVKISDHFMERMNIDYEIFYNRKGIIKAYTNKRSDRTYRSKLTRIDEVFNNKNHIPEIKDKNSSISIKYSKTGKIETMVYKYKTAIIGCPIQSISFNYDSDDRILNETLITCLDIIVSTYIYRENKIIAINCTIIKTDRYSNKKDTIIKKFDINYDSLGLPISMSDSTNQDLYIKYDYIFKK
jgi:hypothetical protein